MADQEVNPAIRSSFAAATAINVRCGTDSSIVYRSSAPAGWST